MHLFNFNESVCACGYLSVIYHTQISTCAHTLTIPPLHPHILTIHVTPLCAETDSDTEVGVQTGMESEIQSHKSPLVSVWSDLPLAWSDQYYH